MKFKVLSAILVFVCALLEPPCFGRDGSDRPGSGEPAVKFVGAVQGASGASISLSGDGRWMLTSDAQSAKVWDVNTLRPCGEAFIPGEAIRAAAIGTDGRDIVLAGGRNVRIWARDSGHLLHTCPHPAEVLTAELSYDGGQIVTGATDGKLRVWNTGTGALVLERQLPGGVHIAHFSRRRDKIFVVVRGNIAASPRVTAAAYVLNAETGKELFHWKAVEWPEGASWRSGPATLSNDGKLVAMNGFKYLAVIDAQSGEPVGSLDLWDNAHFGMAEALSFSPDGTRIAAACSEGAVVGSSDQTNSILCTLALGAQVRGIQFLPDGEHVVLTAESNDSGVWSVETGEQIIAFHASAVPADHPLVLNAGGRPVRPVPIAAASSDGSVVAAAYGDDHTTSVWKLSARE